MVSVGGNDSFPPRGGLTATGFFLYKRLLLTKDACAQVAQLVEHATENRSVAGSIPALGTTLNPWNLTVLGVFHLWLVISENCLEATG